MSFSNETHQSWQQISRPQQPKLDIPEPEWFDEVHGEGVKAIIDKRVALVGNEALLQNNGIALPNGANNRENPRIYVAIDQTLVGSLDLADRIRPGAKEVIERLKSTGIKRVIMLTGDNAEIARCVAAVVART